MEPKGQKLDGGITCDYLLDRVLHEYGNVPKLCRKYKMLINIKVFLEIMLTGPHQC